MTTARVRVFADSDCSQLTEILRRNGQYDYPDIEGPDAMRRFAACDAAVFLVAESDGRVQGLIRAVYDGSRALIHLLSVDPAVQRQGIGRLLVEAAEAELHRRGAPGGAVTVTDTSADFWKRRGYGALPVQVMLKPQFAPPPQRNMEVPRMPVITVNLRQINSATTESTIRGHKVLIDRPVAKDGKDAGPMGGELLLAALGGCFNSNLLAAIRARDLSIDDISIEINGTLADAPARYASVEMLVRSSYPDRQELEKLVTIAERSCIVANSLKGGLDLTVRVA